MTSVSRIEDFCAIGTGGTPSRDRAERYFVGGSIPWVKSGELRESVINKTEEHVTQAALEETNLKLIPAGALLLAMYGATVGRLGILGVPATTNQAVCHIIPDPKRADTRYLFYSLQACVPVLLSRRVGGAQPNISQSIVRGLDVHLPSLTEQRRIADVLDRAEALRAKRRAALAQLDSLTQSIFLDLFGDPATNPKGWAMEQLGRFAEFRYGTSNKSGAYGKPALRIPNVLDGTIDLSEIKLVPVDRPGLERLRLRDGDILFVRTNGNPEFVGRCAVFDRNLIAPGFDCNEFIYASYLIRARLVANSITPLFLREYLLGAEGRRQLRSRAKTSAGQFNINTESLGAIPVPLPPISLQNEFARRVKAVAEIRTRQRASLAEFDALFNSLQRRAFRGEL